MYPLLSLSLSLSLLLLLLLLHSLLEIATHDGGETFPSLTDGRDHWRVAAIPAIGK